MRETADFKVDTRAAGSGDLGVTIKGPSKCSGEFVLWMRFGEGGEVETAEGRPVRRWWPGGTDGINTTLKSQISEGFSATLCLV